jgi:hypothetical protein
MTHLLQELHFQLLVLAVAALVHHLLRQLQSMTWLYQQNIIAVRYYALPAIRTSSIFCARASPMESDRWHTSPSRDSSSSSW